MASAFELRVFRIFNDAPDVLYVVVWPLMQYGTFITIPLATLVALLFRKVRLAVELGAAGVVVYFLAKLAKDAFPRGRPGAVLADAHLRGVPPGEQGFPSGHAAVSAALAFILFAYLPGRWRWAARSRSPSSFPRAACTWERISLSTWWEARRLGIAAGAIATFIGGVPHEARPERRRRVRGRANAGELSASGDRRSRALRSRVGGADRHRDDQVGHAPDRHAEPDAAHDIERVVGAQVDPRERHDRHDDPRRVPPAASQVRGDHPRERRDQDDVAGDERDAVVAVPPRTMAFGSVTPGRCRSTTCQTMRSAASLKSVTRSAASASRYRRRTSATSATTGPTDEHPEELRQVHRRLEALGQAVDRLEDRRSSVPTVPLRAMSAHETSTAKPATAAIPSSRRRSNVCCPVMRGP